MNIQIFGSSKCFDTKKAERWFKERAHQVPVYRPVQKGLLSRRVPQRPGETGL